jgi:hypothetical protein
MDAALFRMGRQSAQERSFKLAGQILDTGHSSTDCYQAR